MYGECGRRRSTGDPGAPHSDGARMRHGRRARAGHQTKARDHSDRCVRRCRAGIRPAVESVDDDRCGQAADGDVLTRHMSDWTDIGSLADLVAAERLESDVDGYRVRIARVNGTLYAFEDRCTHDDSPFDDAP